MIQHARALCESAHPLAEGSATPTSASNLAALGVVPQ